MLPTQARSQIDQHLWPQLTYLTAQSEYFREAARSEGISQMSLDQSRVFEHCISWSGFAFSGKIAQQVPMGVWEGPRNLMKAGQCDNRIAQTAETEDQHALDFIQLFRELHLNPIRGGQFDSFWI